MLFRAATVMMGTLLAASSWGGPIEIAEVRGFLHDRSGLLLQVDQLSPSFFSTLNASNVGTFGWEYTNTSGSDLTSVRFFAFLDADLDRALNSASNEFGAFVSLALPPGTAGAPLAASTWEIDEPEFVFGNIVTNLEAGALDNLNAVPIGGPDDVSLALGFDVGILRAGETLTATFEISVNDIGGLRQQDPDSGTQFYWNGSAAADSAAAIPEPGTLALLLAGGLCLFGMAKTRGRRRPPTD